ncbi:MAG: CinA family nicotinamide mononucleotide deamidase-related protein [Phycisphaeraceae bacterium]|nr:MAG: CinA family nicotinamide mononucleotide deamidase-related protein [Phycisphaeraceae bacterium]
MSEPVRPAPHRTAAILSIGDELTLGQTLDTNSKWIADRLFARGVRVVEHATVEDDLVRITAAIERLAGENDLLVCTGGLGPTLDDLTRDSLARVLGEPLEEDAAAMAAVAAWFEGRGGMPESNRVQALRPASARFLENPNGTAPGLAAWCERLGADIFCLPGPPHEMTPMLDSFVLPAVRRADGRVTHARIILTFGVGESRIAERLGALMDRDRESRGLPVVGTTASRGVVACRLRCDAASDAEARVALDEVEAEIGGRLGPAVFDHRDLAAGDSGDVTDALPRALVDLLRERGERLAVVESCTGGLLGGEITKVAGSSDVFVGGWQTYSNEMKAAMVGVPAELIAREGAVSAACALAMAQGGLERCEADHVMAITGVAGPGGGSGDKPVGTVYMARASRDGSDEVRRFLFRGGREAVRAWSLRMAIGVLRLHLIDAEMRLLGEMA